MPFEKGQAYVCIEDGRRAVVTDTRDGGRSGLLRFGDTGAEEWFLWEPFYHAAQWQRMRRFAPRKKRCGAREHY